MIDQLKDTIDQLKAMHFMAPAPWIADKLEELIELYKQELQRLAAE